MNVFFNISLFFSTYDKDNGNPTKVLLIRHFSGKYCHHSQKAPLASGREQDKGLKFVKVV